MFHPEKLKLKQILSDAILLLCKSALPFDSELSVQALIGITCDQSDICLVSIEEVVKKSAGDGDAEDVPKSSSAGSAQACSVSLSRGSNDGLLSSSLPRNADFAAEKYCTRKKKLPGYEKNRETSQASICLDGTKSARPGSYDNYEAESVISCKRQRLEQSISQISPQCELKTETNHGKWRTGVPSFRRSNQIQQLDTENQQRLDSTHAYSSICDRSKTSSTDTKLTEPNAFSSEAVEIKIEPITVDEDEEEKVSVKEEYAEVSFTDHFQDDGSQFSFGGICQAPCQFPINDKNFNFQQSQESLLLNENVSDADQQRRSQEAIQRRSQRDRQVKRKVFNLCRDAGDIFSSITLRNAGGGVSFQGAGPTTGKAWFWIEKYRTKLNLSISTLICQQVLKYEGPFVTVRDIQRRRLRQVSANHIKSSMNQLTVDGLGFYKTLCLGIMVFYKCPPSIIDPDILRKYNVSREHYEQLYNQRSYITSSNRHSANYWERITMSSPYTEDIVR